MRNRFAVSTVAVWLAGVRGRGGGRALPNALATALALILAFACSDSFTSADERADAGGADAGSDGPANPACSDGVQNGAEIAVDCGGGCPCDPGLPCQVPGDCKTSVCTGGKCQPANCTDGFKNGEESDVDCGGNACPPCAGLKACGSGADCASGVCTGNICQMPTCDDGTTNANETDIDCGGPSCPKCDDTKGCKVVADCKSSICIQNKCVSAACVDGQKNGDETDVDCGGSCAGCAVGEACSVASDCQSDVCTGGSCQAPSCNDNVLNGTESDVDCGGAACPGCAATKKCKSKDDCSSAVCLTGVCQAPACNDSIKNGDESDIDCGGALCPGCKNGEGCTAGNDCASGGCATNKTCTPWSKAFGDVTGIDEVNDIAVDSFGNVHVVGAFEGTANFGGQSYTSTGSDVFVAKYDRTGAHIWSQAFPGPGVGVAYGVAVDSAGNLVVVGYFSVKMQVGGDDLFAAGNDAFAVKLNPTGGVLWKKNFPTGRAYGVAVRPTGEVFICGVYGGGINLGGGSLPPHGSNDAFVARLAGSDGSHVWSKGFGSSDSDLARDIALNGADPVITGFFRKTINFGGASFTSKGLADLFVAKFSGSSGSHLWSLGAGTTGSEEPHAVAANATDIVISGTNGLGTLDLGGGPLAEAFVAKYSSAGNHQWSKGFSSTSSEAMRSGSFAANGDVWVSGYAGAAIDLGGGALPFNTGRTVFVGRFAGSSGAHLVSTGFTTGANSQPNVIAALPGSSAPIIAGVFGGSIDFGAGPHSSSGTDAFVASLGLNP